MTTKSRRRWLQVGDELQNNLEGSNFRSVEITALVKIAPRAWTCLLRSPRREQPESIEVTESTLYTWSFMEQWERRNFRRQ